METLFLESVGERSFPRFHCLFGYAQIMRKASYKLFFSVDLTEIRTLTLHCMFG